MPVRAWRGVRLWSRLNWYKSIMSSCSIDVIWQVIDREERNFQYLIPGYFHVNTLVCSYWRQRQRIFCSILEIEKTKPLLTHWGLSISELRGYVCESAYELLSSSCKYLNVFPNDAHWGVLLSRIIPLRCLVWRWLVWLISSKNCPLTQC